MTPGEGVIPGGTILLLTSAKGNIVTLKYSLSLSLALLGIIAVASHGCATGDAGFDNLGGAGGASSSGVSSTSGVGGGGTGGEGGQGGTPSPCNMDCSGISTDQCHEAVCQEETGQCAVINTALGTPCDDEQFCTVDEVCNEGICSGGAPNDCGMQLPPCSEIICNEATQSCSTAPSAEGTICTSTDLCMVNASCQSGQCVGSEKDCFFAPLPNDCYVAECNSATGDCDPIPSNDGLACFDPSSPCQVNTICDNAGNCLGGNPKDCSHMTVGCVDGVCDQTSGACVGQPIPPGSTCAAATDDCNLGVCDTSGDCIGNPINEGGLCDDGLACTSGTTCTSGACSGGTSTITIYFSEDFSSNSAGWTLGPEWAIGPTSVSTGHIYGNADPALDHSNTADNGVAGVVLGGNAQTTVHSFYYLESPPVDVSAAPTVWLEFWRWLNSDYASFMVNQVEVFNGSSWVVLWASGGSPGVQDAAWTAVSFDITAYKNAQLRVRFGFSVGSGAFTVSQWNVDDVVIATGVCNP